MHAINYTAKLACSPQAADFFPLTLWLKPLCAQLAIDGVCLIWCHGNKRLDNCSWNNPLLLRQEKGELLLVTQWWGLSDGQLSINPEKMLSLELIMMENNCNRIWDFVISSFQTADGVVKLRYSTYKFFSR